MNPAVTLYDSHGVKKNMYRIIWFIAFCFCTITGCFPVDRNDVPEKTQVEIRLLQTRVFSIDDSGLVMKSVLNVLQDDNYVVKNVALDLGFLTAIQEKDVEGVRNRSWAHLAAGADARYPKHEIIEATVNVSELGKEIRVRANFQSKVLDNMGTVVKIYQITDAPFYQEFFTKVGEGIFTQD